MSETFWSGENIDPYYAIGTKTAGLSTTDEALAAAGLGWEVELVPSTFEWNGETRVMRDRFAAVRTDGKGIGLDVVGGSYKTTQNREAFAFLDNIADTGEALWSAAGERMGGKRVFATMKLTDAFTVAGEEMDGYLMFVNSHDGKTAFKVATTVVRPICHNMVQLALTRAKTSWRMTHRTTLTGRVEEAREALQFAHAYKDAFAAEVDALLDVEVTKDRFLDIVKELLPEQRFAQDRKLDGLAAGWEHETTPQDGTGWQALNAMTVFTDHLTTYRSDEARLRSLESGPAWNLRNSLRDRLLANV